MKTSSNCNHDRATAGGRERPRWPWALLLAASGCIQWPSTELEGSQPAAGERGSVEAPAIAGGARAPLASAEAAQSQSTAGSTGTWAWHAELSSERAPLIAAGLSASGGLAFVASTASVGLDGSSSSAGDAQLAAYASADGAPLWALQLGSAEADAASGVAAAGERVVLAGRTAGSLGAPQQGFGDAFVAAYSDVGEQLWIRQLGSSQPDAALGVSLDASGAVVVAGDTRGALEGVHEGADRDAFLAKLGPDGELIFTRQLGSQVGYDDVAVSVATDVGGDVVIAGHTFGGMQGGGNGSADAFVARYSGDGALLWTAQLGGGDYDTAEAVSVGATGDVYVAGQTGGFLAGGPGVVVGSRPLLAKYSQTGELLWTTELEDAEMGSASAVGIDATGEVWIAGHTSASLAGPNQGTYDTFLARFSPEGERLSVLQVGSSDADRAVGLGLDGDRLLLLSKTTRGGDAAFDGALLSGLDLPR